MGLFSFVAPALGAISGGLLGGAPGAMAGGSAGAAISSAFGASEANDANMAIANQTNAMNAEQAQKNRDFQAYMSNTMHQREMDDLKTAGLNPILAANSGASTPSGSTASMQGATMQNEAPDFSRVVSSAMDAKRLHQDLEQSDEQIKLLKEQQKSSREQAKKSAAEATTAQIVAQDADLTQQARTGIYSSENNFDIPDFYKQKIQTEKSNMSIERKANDLESSKLDFDKDAQSFDNIMSRVGQVTGAINNATSALRPRISIGGEKPGYPRKQSAPYYKVHKQTGEILP